MEQIDVFEKPEATENHGGVFLSLSALATEFGFARETIKRQLDQAGIEPSRMRAGFPTYRLRDAIAAWRVSPDAAVDVDALPPYQRKAHYQAEREKLQLLTEHDELVARVDVEREQARIINILARALDTLPDILERDVGATPQQLQKIEQHCDRARNEIYAELTSETSEP